MSTGKRALQGVEAHDVVRRRRRRPCRPRGDGLPRTRCTCRRCSPAGTSSQVAEVFGLPARWRTASAPVSARSASARLATSPSTHSSKSSPSGRLTSIGKADAEAVAQQGRQRRADPSGAARDGQQLLRHVAGDYAWARACKAGVANRGRGRCPGGTRGGSPPVLQRDHAVE